MREYQIAFIHESQCVGCTQCLAVCPVDSIVGASGLMHTVLAEQCIGCELCIPACPVDCIVLEEAPKGVAQDVTSSKKRAAVRRARLLEKQSAHSAPPPAKQAIFDLIARVKSKKQAE